MTINLKCYSALLLTASITLTGCQTTKIVPPKTMPYSENIIVSTIDIIDSDGDGVSDELDDCPGSPHNMVIDKSGCPYSPLFSENEFRMEARAYYDENSSEIKSEYYEQLDKAGKKMEDHLDAIMLVEGHISTKEDNSANQTLSRYRAEGIKNYIVMNYDIDSDRIKTSYYGSDRPIALNDAENSWLNQRIYALISNVD